MSSMGQCGVEKLDCDWGRSLGQVGPDLLPPVLAKPQCVGLNLFREDRQNLQEGPGSGPKVCWPKVSGVGQLIGKVRGMV